MKKIISLIALSFMFSSFALAEDPAFSCQLIGGLNDQNISGKLILTGDVRKLMDYKIEIKVNDGIKHELNGQVKSAGFVNFGSISRNAQNELIATLSMTGRQIRELDDLLLLQSVQNNGDVLNVYIESYGKVAYVQVEDVDALCIQ